MEPHARTYIAEAEAKRSVKKDKSGWMLSLIQPLLPFL